MLYYILIIANLEFGSYKNEKKRDLISVNVYGAEKYANYRKNHN